MRLYQTKRETTGKEKIYASYNAAPTRFMAVAKQTTYSKATADDACQVEIEAMKWGMVIPNTTDIVINGRLEELYRKPFFRNLLETKRAVLTVNGYFEWTQKGEKLAFLIKPREASHTSGHLSKQSKLEQPAEPTDSSQVLQFACLYNNAFQPKDSPGDYHNNFVILTTDSDTCANKEISNVHHRMPVLLNDDTRQKWLSPTLSFTDCVGAIKETSDIATKLQVLQVSDQVNSIRNQGVQCILEKQAFDQLQMAKNLGRFFKPVSQQDATASQGAKGAGLKQYIKEIRENRHEETKQQQNTKQKEIIAQVVEKALNNSGSKKIEHLLQSAERKAKAIVHKKEESKEISPLRKKSPLPKGQTKLPFMTKSVQD